MDTALSYTAFPNNPNRKPSAIGALLRNWALGTKRDFLPLLFPMDTGLPRRLVLSLLLLLLACQSALAGFVVDQNGQVWEVKYQPRWAIVIPLIISSILLLGGVVFLAYWLIKRRYEESDVYDEQEQPKPAGGATV
ncbi:unnamed protein product [Closterium sp. Yama58-4]|nr:unnamed protein product [Closterium sp. Yama58-4]